jgi:hypothetical protein
MQANALICDLEVPSAFSFGNRSDSPSLTLQHGRQYARLTLTRFTTLYFFFAIIICSVLSVQQGLTFSKNSAAVSALSSFITEESGHRGLVVLEKGVLEICDGLPDQPGTNCSKIMTFGENNNLTSRSLWDDVFIVCPSIIFTLEGSRSTVYHLAA